MIGALFASIYFLLFSDCPKVHKLCERYKLHSIENLIQTQYNANWQLQTIDWFYWTWKYILIKIWKSSTICHRHTLSYFLHHFSYCHCVDAIVVGNDAIMRLPSMRSIRNEKFANVTFVYVCSKEIKQANKSTQKCKHKQS